MNFEYEILPTEPLACYFAHPQQPDLEYLTLAFDATELDLVPQSLRKC